MFLKARFPLSVAESQVSERDLGGDTQTCGEDKDALCVEIPYSGATVRGQRESRGRQAVMRSGLHL